MTVVVRRKVNPIVMDFNVTEYGAILHDLAIAEIELSAADKAITPGNFQYHRLGIFAARNCCDRDFWAGDEADSFGLAAQGHVDAGNIPIVRRNGNCLAFALAERVGEQVYSFVGRRQHVDVAIVVICGKGFV